MQQATLALYNNRKIDLKSLHISYLYSNFSNTLSAGINMFILYDNFNILSSLSTLTLLPFLPRQEEFHRNHIICMPDFTPLANTVFGISLSCFFHGHQTCDGVDWISITACVMRSGKTRYMSHRAILQK